VQKNHKKQKYLERLGPGSKEQRGQSSAAYEHKFRARRKIDREDCEKKALSKKLRKALSGFGRKCSPESHQVREKKKTQQRKAFERGRKAPERGEGFVQRSENFYLLKERLSVEGSIRRGCRSSKTVSRPGKRVAREMKGRKS